MSLQNPSGDKLLRTTIDGKGKVVQVDTTDFSKVDDDKIVQQVRDALRMST